MNPRVGLESTMFECDVITAQQKIKYLYIPLEFKENAALI